MEPDKKTTKKHLSITVYYLLTALVCSWPAFWKTGFLILDWGRIGFQNVPTVYLVHMFILGFMLTVTFGILYQFIPIAFQAPPNPRHVIGWHLPIHIAAVFVMVYGFQDFRLEYVALGGSVLFVNTIVYGSFLLKSYRKAKNKTFVYSGLWIPILILIAVMLLGLWMAFDLPGISRRLLLEHVLAGVFGFWLGLVLVISYKFVPMFTLSHGYQIRPKATVRSYASAIVLLLVGNLLPGSVGEVVVTIAAIISIASLFQFGFDMYRIIKARKRKRIVMQIKYALASLCCLCVSSILLLVALIIGSSDLMIFGAYLVMYAGFLPLIFSYMQKIIPFLWYEYRFSHRPERKQAPAMDDMVPRTRAKWAMNLYFATVICGGVAVMCDRAVQWTVLQKLILSYVFGVAFLAGPILLFTGLVQVLTIGGRRPQD